MFIAKKIRKCLDVIGILDAARVFDPDLIPKLHDALFNFSPDTAIIDFCLR